MELAEKEVLVFGAGLSGRGAAELLQSRGAHVHLYDGNATLNKEEIDAQLTDPDSVDLILGDFPEALLSQLDLVVLSPGVPTDLPLVETLRSKQIPITGEVELAYTCGAGDVLAVTGTNGKTTTTTLLGEIMQKNRENVFVVGNIGNPYTLIANQTDEQSVVVAEMSSFQLETIDTFHPKVSAILNITPDHMNRHHTMDAYVAAKERIAGNQTDGDYCILNYEDDTLRTFAQSLCATPVYFSSRRRLPVGAYLHEGSIYYRSPEEPGIEQLVCRTEDLKVLGVHNYENVMAAVTMAAVYGVPMETIRTCVLAFRGVAHRIEFVAEKKGVAYYNDSKGTNPDAAIKGIQAMNRPTVLIGGGYDKGSDYTEWIQSFDGRVKRLVLLGETKEKIARAADAVGFTDYVFADSFKEAFCLAAEAAEEGDAVLLSPACASWDMFPNYEVRGDTFKEYVQAL